MTPSSIEGAGYRAMQSLYQDARRIGGATLFRQDGAPDSAMVNRVVGLGLDRPATETAVDEILAAMRGVRCFVAVSPHAEPEALEGWLSQRGLQRGWGWMQFSRGVDQLPHVETDLRIARIGPELGADFARVVVRAFELPETLTAWFTRVPAIDGWSVWLAFDGDQAVASGSLFVDGEVGYLGFGATFKSHRGRGGQGALLAARIRGAAELGCRHVVTETGERLPDRPSNSYRNILRAGFQEQFVVSNWLRSRTVESA
jgi:hypothetical protein